MLYIGLYREQHEKILSETTRPRAMIFGMKHYLVVFYPVCSNNTPGAKNGHTPVKLENGVLVWNACISYLYIVSC